MKRKAYKILSIEKQYLQYDYLVINCENGITKFIKQHYHKLFPEYIYQHQPVKGDWLIEYTTEKGKTHYCYENASKYDNTLVKKKLNVNKSSGLREQLPQACILPHENNIYLSDLKKFFDDFDEFFDDFNKNYTKTEAYMRIEFNKLIRQTEFFKNLDIEAQNEIFKNINHKEIVKELTDKCFNTYNEVYKSLSNK